MSKATAKVKYSTKVCAKYLGISTKGCDAAFQVLLDHMQTGYEALAPSSNGE